MKDLADALTDLNDGAINPEIIDVWSKNYRLIASNAN